MKKYLVIGNPIEHSLSPKLQNWLKENNIDATYDKIKLEVHEIRNFIQEIKDQKIYHFTFSLPLFTFTSQLTLVESYTRTSLSTITFVESYLVPRYRRGR